MPNPYTKHKRAMVTTLENLFLEHPKAKTVEYRYKSLRYVLKRHFSGLEGIPDDHFEKILKDCVFLDRKIRKLTEGIDQEKKEILSQEKILELGYEVGVDGDIKKLNKNI